MQKKSTDCRHSPADGCRLFKPDSRLFLPDLSLTGRRGRGTRHLSDGISCPFGCICPVLRGYPDLNLPSGGQGCRLRKGFSPDRTYHFPVFIRASCRTYLAVRSVYRPLCPLRAGLRAAFAGHGPVHSLFLHPRLHLRLLLWYEAHCRSGTLPDVRAGHPHERRLSDGTGPDGKRRACNGVCGGLGHVYRRSWIGCVQLSGLCSERQE